MHSTELVNYHKSDLEAQANRILDQAGYYCDGRPKTAKRKSVKAVSVPCGGKPGYRRK